MSAAKAVMQLRSAFCQTSAGSAGVREFWAKNYASIKAANTKLPILIRESSGAPASLTATYEFGAEKSVDLEGLSAADVGTSLQQLMKG